MVGIVSLLPEVEDNCFTSQTIFFLLFFTSDFFSSLLCFDMCFLSHTAILPSHDHTTSSPLRLCHHHDPTPISQPCYNNFHQSHHENFGIDSLLLLSITFKVPFDMGFVISYINLTDPSLKHIISHIFVSSSYMGQLNSIMKLRMEKQLQQQRRASLKHIHIFCFGVKEREVSCRTIS